MTYYFSLGHASLDIAKRKRKTQYILHYNLPGRLLPALCRLPLEPGEPGRHRRREESGEEGGFKIIFWVISLPRMPPCQYDELTGIIRVNKTSWHGPSMSIRRTGIHVNKMGWQDHTQVVRK